MFNYQLFEWMSILQGRREKELLLLILEIPMAINFLGKFLIPIEDQAPLPVQNEPPARIEVADESSESSDGGEHINK